MTEPNPDKASQQSSLEQRLDIVVSEDRSAEPSHPFLLLLSRTGVGQLFPLTEEECLIGRSSSAHISLDERALSHRHARVVQRDGEHWLEDLGSTNGTFVNDQQVTMPCRLRPNDVIRLGETRLLFLANAASAEHTIDLRRNSHTAPLLPGHALPSPVHAPHVSMAEDLGGTNLPLLLERVSLGWQLFKRYAWLGILLVSLGVAAGLAHTRINPQPGFAWFEITLISETKENPIEDNGEWRKEAFFLAPANTFSSLPLVVQTLKKLGVEDVSPGLAKQVQRNLSLSQQGYRSQLWRGEYHARSANEDPAKLLDTHLKIYLDHEIATTLKVFDAEIKFYENQLKEARQVVSDADKRFVKFREEHPNILPGRSANPKVASLKGAQAQQSATLAKTQEEIRRTRAKLERGDEVLQQRMQAVASYDQQLAQINAKIASARAGGLGDEHPEIKQLKAEASNINQLKNKLLNTKATSAERRANPELRGLEDRLHELKRKEESAKARVARLRNATAEAEKPQASVPQLEAMYEDLDRQIKDAQALEQTIAQKVKASKLQMELERASAEGKYSLITPPTEEEPSHTKSALKWGGLGGVVGLFLACCIAGFVELRRYAQRLRLA